VVVIEFRYLRSCRPNIRICVIYTLPEVAVLAAMFDVDALVSCASESIRTYLIVLLDPDNMRVAV